MMRIQIKFEPILLKNKAVFAIYRNFYAFYPYVLFIVMAAIFGEQGSADTILKVDTLWMIQTNFGSDWPSGFRGKDF